MKRLISLIAVAALAATMMSGCTSKSGTEIIDTADTAVEDVIVEEVLDRGTMNGYTASELIAQMKTGWNLGNSLDSVGVDETAWGNPRTTKEMIDTVKEAGFDILRIPVTWSMHMGEAPDYKVDEAFMARVAEVVDYGIANDMFVMLDIHHETDSWLLPQSESMDEVIPKFTALWQQIAERFSEYGDHLIFEGMNEPRVKGSPNEWGGGTQDGRECVEQLNRIFVDTVRATGGNNEQRLLLVTTYAHASAELAVRGLNFDYDPYVGVAIHAYVPYSFTYHSGESYETFHWDGSENTAVDSLFETLDEYFISKGIPVMITEYGAVTKTVGEEFHYNTEDICAWAEYYLGKAKELGIPCVWWDNNYYYSGNELFGLLDRKLCEWYSPKIVETVTGMYKENKEVQN